MADDYDCDTMLVLAKAVHKILQNLVEKSKFSRELKDEVAFWIPVFESNNVLQIRAQCSQMRQKLKGDKKIEQQLNALIGLLDAAIKQC